MTLEKLNRQARYWTLFKLIVLMALIGVIGFLIWQGAGTTPLLTAPTITSPPTGIVGEVVELSGGGMPRGVVEIAVNGEPIGQTLVSPTGRWAYALPAFTEAGDYNVSATAVDLYTQNTQPNSRQTAILTIREAPSETVAQEPSSTPTAEPSPTPAPTSTTEPLPTTTLTTTVEPSPTNTPPPTATADPLLTFTPFVLPPHPEDGIPADGRFVLRGEGVPSSTIQILLNDSVVDTVTVDANGLFTATIQLTDFDDYKLQVQTVDESGTILLEGEPFIYTYVNRLAIDPILEAQATLSETLQISGSAVVSSEVQIVVNDEVIASVQADGDGRWTYELLFTESGDYDIVVQALAEDGTVLATATQLITVEAAAEEENLQDEGVELDHGNTISAVLTTIEADGQLNTLLTALEAAVLTETLNSSDPFILLAPTDNAFAALPAEAVTALFENPVALTNLLLHHVITETTELAAGQQITTATGGTLLITEQESTLYIGRAQVLTITETAAGPLYIIDQLLMPTAADITPPIIDDSGVPTYEGPFLTVVGTAEPETRLVVMINGELYGEAPVAEDGTWLVDGIINPPGEFNIIAYTLSDEGLPLAVSPPVLLTVE